MYASTPCLTVSIQLSALVIMNLFILCMHAGTPTLQQLSKALKTLENWLVFGVKLGVPFSQLKKIESSYSQRELELCKLDMLQYWLDNNLVPKWNEVILALEETDQLALAAQIKHDYVYLFSSAADSEEEGMLIVLCVYIENCSKICAYSEYAPISDMRLITRQYGTSPATPPSSTHSSFCPVSTRLATDEIKAEIEADVTVVSNLKDLEISFGRMIVRVKRHLEKCDLSDAKLFLYSAIGTKVFSGCDNFGELLEKLQQDHIDVFNITLLQQLMANFELDKSTNEVIEAYNEKMENFLKQTSILEFQRAVVSRVEPILARGMAEVTITISEDKTYDRTLMDIQKLAKKGFKECHKKLIHLKAKLSSIIISWVFPKGLSGRLEQLACDNAAVFNDNGVVEVTVGGRRVFPCTQQEVRINSSPLM